MPICNNPRLTRDSPTQTSRRLLSSQTVLKSLDRKYTHIQFVGFEINTMPNGFETGSNPNDDWYIGLPDATSDITARVNLVRDVIDKAIRAPSIDPKALKVFMMPEFFFRGENGAYSTRCYAYIYLSWGLFYSQIGAYTAREVRNADLYGKLADLIYDEKWADWLFVFGTIVGQMDDVKCKFDSFDDCSATRITVLVFM